MDNVPVHVNHGAGAHVEESLNTGKKTRRSKGRKKLVAISIGVIVLVAVIVLAALMVYRSSVGSLIDGSKYQAVFLTNGQSYFGKLAPAGGSYMELTDIFYLQTKPTDSTAPQQTTPDTTAQVQLVKLGDEIHGPSDQMIIDKSQILFFENLKSDGKVAQSIAAYQKK